MWGDGKQQQKKEAAYIQEVAVRAFETRDEFVERAKERRAMVILFAAVKRAAKE